MKKILFCLLFMAGIAEVFAQNCEEIVLPFFGNDTSRMESYPRMKLDYRCHFSKEAFYESDTIPAGAYLHQISEVVDVFTGQHLPADYVVDLEHLSYYRYSFHSMQVQFNETNKVLCFQTPSSAKPYLIVRSIQEIGERAEAALRRQYGW